MARSYRHIQEYEKEIMELRTAGRTQHEICDKYGFNQKQLKNFINRYNRRQDKIAAGIAIKHKGRQAKDWVVSEEKKANVLRYIITRKDARIKTLEMENKLLRDFLLSTERK